MSAHSVPGSPITVFASSARTATATSDVYRIQGGHYTGLAVQISVTAASATPSVVFTVESQAGQGDDFTTQLASAAITATGTTNLILHASAADTANISESTQIERKWRIVGTHADADSITYSVKAWPLI